MPSLQIFPEVLAIFYFFNWMVNDYTDHLNLTTNRKYFVVLFIPKRIYGWLL